MIVAAAVTLPLGITSSKEYAELEWPIHLLITAVWVAYAVVFFGTIARRKVRVVEGDRMRRMAKGGAASAVEVAGATTLAVAVAVQMDPADVKPGSHAIVFHIEDIDDPRIRADEKSRFFAR